LLCPSTDNIRSPCRCRPWVLLPAYAHSEVRKKLLGIEADLETLRKDSGKARSELGPLVHLSSSHATP
jgi:hypothetical protein